MANPVTRPTPPGPSLLSSSVSQPDAREGAILAALSGSARSDRMRGRRRAGIGIALSLLAVLGLLAALAVGGRPAASVEAPAVRPRPPAADDSMDALAASSPAPIAGDATDQGGSATIRISQRPARVSTDPVQASPLPLAVHRPPAEAGGGADGADGAPHPEVTAARSKPGLPANRSTPTAQPRKPGRAVDRAPPQPAQQAAAAVPVDEDVRLLAALMAHAGSPGFPDEAGRIALRKCGAMAPSDREACVAALCAQRRVAASVCDAQPPR